MVKLNMNVEAQLWKAHVRSEDISTEAWNSNWGWLLPEYTEMTKALDKATEESVLPKPPPKLSDGDTRILKPMPYSTTNEVGWLSSRKEFRLEKFGPDVYKGMPFKGLYD